MRERLVLLVLITAGQACAPAAPLPTRAPVRAADAGPLSECGPGEDCGPISPDDGSDCLEFEVCDGEFDQDCDGLVGCDDPDCQGTSSCGPTGDEAPADPDAGVPGIDEARPGSDQAEPEPECIYQERLCAIPNCNDHPGDDEVACRAQGNLRGCTDLELEAWCTRRVDGGQGGLWFEIHREWVDRKCDGDVQFWESGGRGHYYCEDDCGTYECITPIVLAFHGEAVELVPGAGASAFDLAGTGESMELAWPTAATPWLARDLDGDGRITSGRKLFGSATPLPGGDTAAHGFMALGALDDNGDGRLDAADPAFGTLLAWSDHNQDRISQPGELAPIVDLGVLSIDLDYAVDLRCDDLGNCERERASFAFTGRDGAERTGVAIDVHLAVKRPRPSMPDRGPPVLQSMASCR